MGDSAETVVITGATAVSVTGSTFSFTLPVFDLIEGGSVGSGTIAFVDEVGAVTLTIAADGKLVFTDSEGTQVTSAYGVADLAANGVNEDVSMTSATFATAGLAGKLKLASATVDAAGATNAQLAALVSGDAAVKASSILNLSVTNAQDATALGTLLAKSAAGDATVVATNMVAGQIAALVTGVAAIKAGGITGGIALNATQYDALYAKLSVTDDAVAVTLTMPAGGASVTNSLDKVDIIKSDGTALVLTATQAGQVTANDVALQTSTGSTLTTVTLTGTSAQLAGLLTDAAAVTKLDALGTTVLLDTSDPALSLTAAQTLLLLDKLSLVANEALTVTGANSAAYDTLLTVANITKLDALTTGTIKLDLTGSGTLTVTKAVADALKAASITLDSTDSLVVTGVTGTLDALDYTSIAVAGKIALEGGAGALSISNTALDKVATVKGATDANITLTGATGAGFTADLGQLTVSGTGKINVVAAADDTGTAFALTANVGSFTSSTGAQEVTLAAGSTASVSLGADDDILNVGGVTVTSGILNGGDGTGDTIKLATTADISAATVSGFEKISFDAQNQTLILSSSVFADTVELLGSTGTDVLAVKVAADSTFDLGKIKAGTDWASADTITVDATAANATIKFGADGTAPSKATVTITDFDSTDGDSLNVKAFATTATAMTAVGADGATPEAGKAYLVTGVAGNNGSLGNAATALSAAFKGSGGSMTDAADDAEAVFVLTDGTNTAIYLYTATNGQADVTSTELTLLGTVNGVLTDGAFSFS